MGVSATTRAYFPFLTMQSTAPVRLFCFPHAGGSAGGYRSWIAALAAELEIVPVQLPGREQRLRETPFRSMPALVAALVEAIDPLLADKPFAFFGHSLGAKIAFELTRVLTATGRPTPAAVIVSACPAPNLEDPRPVMHGLSDREFVAALARINGTPAAVLDSEELMALMLPYLRADYELSESYTAEPEPPLRTPLYAFGGSSDPEATSSELEAWARFTRSSFQLRSFPGDHFYLGAAFAPLASALRELLAPLEGSRDVAVIGMSGRFPGARDIEQLWQNLCSGVSSIRRFTSDELIDRGADPALVRHPRFVPAAGLLEGSDEFDAAFFGFSPKEAELTDPQQRLLLETAETALEHAGYAVPDDEKRVTGVYVGTSPSSYGITHASSREDMLDPAATLQVRLGNARDFAASRISNRLGLRGPSLTLQTASSTSLVAVHAAAQALLAGECELALAGGASVATPGQIGHVFQRGGKDSPDEHCRPFAADANGTVWGSGVGVVVLKRLRDAARDGDTIHAVIKGSAVNNDGGATAFMTAPSADGQARVMTRALDRAGVAPESVGYVEAHGTGTALGDPVEFEALNRVFGRSSQRKHACAVGSIKANIGHLDAAAGIAGFIKAALVVREGHVPPLLNHVTPNPALDLANSSLFFNTELAECPTRSAPRRAAVSSFGMGGTNAHVILEQAPPAAATVTLGEPELVVLSAKTETALERACAALAGHLGAHPDAALGDVAHTLQRGRQRFRFRRAVSGRSSSEVASALAAPVSASSARPRRVAFLFPGQGAQYPEMAAELYAGEPLFRDAFDRCALGFTPHLDVDLRQLLYAGGAARALDETWLTQPALFAVEYALLELWRGWGVKPHAFLGHSVGEYVAAHAAGVFSFEDALCIVALRGNATQSAPRGAMLAVALSEARVRAHLDDDDDLSLAAVNAADLCVVSGTEGAIASLASSLDYEGVKTRRLRVSHAFHSALMEPVLSEFREAFRKIRLAPPSLPFVSNLTGSWITSEQATDPSYWVRHLRHTVQFSAGIGTLLEDEDLALLEVGPGQTLRALARRAAKTDASRSIVASLPGAKGRSERVHLYAAAGELWASGIELSWEAVRQGRPGRRVPLPSYPFERVRHFISASGNAATDTSKQREMEASPPPAPPEVARPEAQELAAMWTTVLGVEHAAPEADFHALGGHSLLATQLLERIEARFGVVVPMAQFFEQPTLRALERIVAETPSAPKAPKARFSESGRHVPFALTDIQQAYWVGRRSELPLGGVACRIYVEFERPELDVERLNLALERLIQRHDMLRAVVTEDGRQRVLAEVPAYRAAELDLRELSPEVAERRLQELRAALSHEVFAPERWPLFDVRVSRLPASICLHLGFDLLIADAASLEIIARELAVLYDTPEALPPPPAVTFRDCVLSRELDADSTEARAARAYWQERLASLPPGPELPLARSPEGLSGQRFSRLKAELPAEVSARLVARARDAGLSLSALFLAVYADILARWSRAPRFSVSATLLDRPPIDPRVAEVIGDFSSVTLLVVEPASSTFLERARSMQRELWNALDHRGYSGVRVARELARSTRAECAHAPVVFTSLLDALGPSPAFFSESSWFGRQRYGITQTPQVWLDQQVYRDGSRLCMNWDYVPELFPTGLVEDMFESATRLLERLAAESESWRAAAPLTLPKHQLERFAASNATSQPLPSGLLHEPFREQAARSPEAVAVITRSRRLTYAELARYSRRIGRFLRAEAVRPNDLVAVVMPPGWEQVAAVLGILESGGAYLPIDANQPPERIRKLLELGEVRLALVSQHTPDSVVWPATVRRHAIGVPFESEPWLPDDVALDTVQSPEDLAYVIFTSGSTGTPKGVMIDHRGPLNTISDLNRRFAIGPQDRVLAVSALHFDLSVYDVFGVLAAGGAIVIPEASRHRDPNHWLDLVARERVTLWNSVPALLDVLLEQAALGNPDALASLRVAWLSGDWIPLELPNRLRGFRYGIEVVSLGGATEASIWSNFHVIERIEPEWKSIPYGKPLANQQLYVLNARLEPCPMWVSGKLFIGGVGLARGYFRDEEKTRALFVVHPESGERLYDTGDLGRYLPDGSIELLGREDSQVKLRGYRVELGEIEAHLGRHPAVHANAVNAHHSGLERRLVGYVVPKPGNTPTAAELRLFLERSLPEYMVPSSFVLLDALPLTPNGKLDRTRLVPPPAAAERKRELMQKVLALDPGRVRELLRARRATTETEKQHG